MNIIPYARQWIDEEDIQAVADVLRSDWLTQGPKVSEFESAVANYCGSRFAVAANSGTAALHLACMALELGPGDCLWTSPNTFVASANCALYCGASVDFVDIEPDTGNISVVALEQKLRHAERKKRLPKILVPVHFAGQPCDMADIAKLCRDYGIAVVEDACHALGARYREQPAGCGGYADITVLSFHPVKIITTAEGGMALTQREDLAQRMKRLVTHGITRDPAQLHEASAGGWYYEQTELGYNYRLSDLQAALGVSQMGKLNQFIERRRQLAQRYDKQLAAHPLAPLRQKADRQSSYHLYIARLQAASPVPRAELFRRLREAGIGVNVHYIPVYWQPYYQRLGFSRGYCPGAEQYYETTLSLPLYPGLSEAEQDTVVQTLILCCRP